MFGANDSLGKCPVCGGDILMGKYGAYCSEKCGMSIGRAYGKELTEEQVRDILSGDRIYVEGIRSRKGGVFNAYLVPGCIEDYSYTKKDGTQVNGFQYKFTMEFDNKEDGGDPHGNSHNSADVAADRTGTTGRTGESAETEDAGEVTGESAGRGDE